MTILQSETALRRKPVKTAYAAGIEVTNEFEITLAAGVDADVDVIEIGMVPNLSKLTALEITGANVGAITATVGLLDGEFGSDDATRDIATSIAAALDINDATASVAGATLRAITPPTENVGLGIVLSADVAGGATKTIKVLMKHMAA